MEVTLREHLESGTPVTIWYNPAHPEEAILDRSMPWDMFILSIVGSILFLVIGLGLGFALYRYTLQT